VGIDPRVEHLPPGFRDRFGPGLAGSAEAYEAFGRGVIDAIASIVPGVKFQMAFFEALGPAGMVALHRTAAFARERGLIVILDGKRNDIGPTAEAYAQAYLGPREDAEAWPADATTVNPYLGSDGVAPFVDQAARSGKGVFVLVRTSNPSAREFQDLDTDGAPAYRRVAENLARWAEPHRGIMGYSLIGAVVGATYPDELAQLRAALPRVLFLVPGYGSQGGTARDVAAAFDSEGLGALVNNSRGIAFAYERPEFQTRSGGDWQRAVELAARAMIEELDAVRPRV
jgi:orotidine-5'-phosphate decarboxylase